MSDLGDIKDGIKTVLEKQINGLRVYADPLGTMDYPAIVIEAQDGEGELLTMGDNTYEFRLNMIVYVWSGNPTQAFDELDEYRSMSGSKSIRAAIQTDPTLNSKADAAQVDFSFGREVDRHDLGRTREHSIMVPIRVLKTVA